MPAIDLGRWTGALLDDLQRSRQRQLVVLQGSQSWCDKQLPRLLSLEPRAVVMSDRAVSGNAVAFAKIEMLLGGEARLVIVDLFNGLDPDALCIAAGLVSSGGALILLSPPLERWNLEHDRYARWQDQTRSARAYFVEYFYSCIERDRRIGIRLSPKGGIPAVPELPLLEPTPIENGVTPEQQSVLDSIERWLETRRGGVALITADRGRGKSTCLGLLARRLQTRAKGDLLVTANSRQTASNLLIQAPECAFIAPDVLLHSRPPADLVIVDEAAMIPLSILRQIKSRYPRLVMATTSGGYEGTGQGFELRFVAALEAEEVLRLRLERPVRWCQGDLLEAWFNRVFMLSREAVAAGRAFDQVGGVTALEVIRNPGARRQIPRVRQVYNLLSSAHYRTRPSDLRMLMENPDQLPIVARAGRTVVGATLLNLEGGFDDALCTEVFLGRRRPRGHLLAQMLTAQAGIARFASLRGARVQRIAVAAACRRQGIGKRMLEFAFAEACERGLDYVGASFALDPETVCFWRQAGFRLVHVSFAAGKSSGDHSVAVLRAVNPALESTIESLQQRLHRQLPIWLTQFLQRMEARQVVALLRFAAYDTVITELERLEVEAFARGQKGFELCFASLQKFVMQQIGRSDLPVDCLLVEKAVQNRDWAELERDAGTEGRRQLQRRLRGLVDALIKPC